MSIATFSYYGMKIKDRKYYHWEYWWNTTPMLRYFVPFSIGVLFYFAINVNLIWIFALGVFSLLVLHYGTNQLLDGNRILYSIAAFGTIILLGYQWSHYKYQLFDTPLSSYEGVFMAEVKEYKAGDHWDQLILKNCVQVDHEEQMYYFREHFILRIKNNILKYSIGDQIGFEARIDPIGPAKNPKAFDFKKYWWVKNVYFQAFVDADQVVKLKPAQLRMIDKARQRIRKIIRHNLVSDRNQAMASALLLGDKSGLDKEIKKVYSDAGTMHVLAVSGLHVGIIASIFFLMFYPVRLFYPEIIKYLNLFSIVGIWFFAYLCNWSPSVTRAVIMLSLLLIGLAFFDNYYGLNIWAAAGFFLMLYHPKYIYDIGFQFSFLAVLGILLCYRPLVKFYYHKSKVINYLWKMVAITLAAQVFLIPFLVYYFHKVPLYFIPNSIIAVLSVYAILVLGVIIIMVDMLSPGFSPLGWIWDWMISMLNQVLGFMSSLKYGVIDHIWISPFQLFLLLIISIGFTVFLIIRHKMALRIAVSSILIFSISYTGMMLNKKSGAYLVLYGDKSRQTDIILQGKAFAIFGEQQTKHSYDMKNIHSFLSAGLIRTITRDELVHEDAILYQNGVLATNTSTILFLTNKNKELVRHMHPSIFDLVIVDDHMDLAEILDHHEFGKLVKRYADQKLSGEVYLGEIIDL